MKVLFYKEKVNYQWDKQTFEDVVLNMKADTRILSVSFKDISRVFSILYSLIAKRKHPLYDRLRHGGLSFFLNFIHSENINKLINYSLGKDVFENDFAIYDQKKNKRIIFTPKGIVGHWIAGNVPILGLISVALSIMSKNKTIIKLPSDQEDYVSDFLQTLNDNNFGRLGDLARIIAENCIVVRFSRTDEEFHHLLANHVDVRVVWGSREAVKSVKNLAPEKEDFTFISLGPKVSCAVIDPSLMTEKHYKALAQDIVVFKQLACTSPQWVFVKSNDTALVKQNIITALNSVIDNNKRVNLSSFDGSQIIKYRAQLLFEGKSITDSGDVFWTIIDTPLKKTFTGYGYHFIGIQKIKSLKDLYQYIPENIQTVSYNLTPDDVNELLTCAQQTNIFRIIRLGQSHDFEVPWDGQNIIDNLMKKIVLWQQE